MQFLNVTFKFEQPENAEQDKMFGYILSDFEDEGLGFYRTKGAYDGALTLVFGVKARSLTITLEGKKQEKSPSETIQQAEVELGEIADDLGVYIENVKAFSESKMRTSMIFQEKADWARVETHNKMALTLHDKLKPFNIVLRDDKQTFHAMRRVINIWLNYMALCEEKSGQSVSKKIGSMAALRRP